MHLSFAATAARAAALVLAVLAAAACSGGGNATEPGNGPPPSPAPSPSPPPGGNGPPRLQRIVSDLDTPVHLAAPPGDSRLFVVEKIGRVRVVKDGTLLPEPFLDLTGQVSTGSEQGLLSIAFHPGYASTGRFFVYFTNRAGDTRVVEYRAGADPDRADPASARTVLELDQPFANHNGGLLLFGPDGELYVGLGDGGGGGDPLEAGQDLGVLLGKILRLDVDGTPPYAVPPDNPFVGRAGARGEIWAYGLRNPWRFAFDRETRDFYVADVGQNQWEEVNAVAAGAAAGLNYGWDLTEGTHCFEPDEGCDTDGLTLPVVEYDHGSGCSVTGGFVYRGQAVEQLRGRYLYSDFCTGFVRSFRLVGGRAADEQRWPQLEPEEEGVTSFGEDASGELYVLTAGGSVYRIVAGPAG